TMHKYYGYLEKFDYVDTARFLRRIEERLGDYQSLFKEAAREYGFDWKLLAAMAYQESHWDPDAVSPTGVRGIMMLTRSTARRVGIDDLLDPRQSIMGGAAYLADLMERLPESVTGPDRIWFAMAAYNIGMGHLYDARRLARRLGKDPDRWSELSEVLPLLARKQYYSTLKHGYARGGEPVRYVNRVRHFRDILERVAE
ncbi:MAG: transglycosylase SLT domain-containing protein, partial [Candidatus Eisenbacteria bacterium]|nr:transglycosylase SLT domain-containing protein [Candidatus Eisenbacteria bacterium]